MARRLLRYRIGDARVTQLDLDREGEDSIFTYGHLFEYLKAKGYINDDHYMQTEDGNNIEPDEQIDFNIDLGVIRFEWNVIAIYVKDLETTQQIRAGYHSTIGDIKKTYNAETNKRVEKLSFKGRELVDTETLISKGIQDGDILQGRFNVIVADQKCELSTAVPVFEFSTVRDLKDSYAAISRRILTPGSMIRYAQAILNDDSSLDDCGIKDMSEVEYENPNYSIVIRDELEDASLTTTLTVCDSDTVAQVKERFSREMRQALVPGDKLVFNGVNLEDDDMLFQHSITLDSELLLSREDSSRALVYECAECGADVRLKKSEPIRCRYCGCRVVFKKRTSRPCQYVAR
eukprot:TRINITY_DN3770_c0_g1_i1.p1 TRINITY_DN3770_c0_g1~~TRINITY_DN3770_c0_g1_i1.p1  ORF type:complete len:347 (-),score=87.24 TRINITY_DN3770_c0_g1_i1:60-1100(-)